ncbi:MAG TPA: hypothetical protein VN193_10795 [Candidatus Angelobacter sp.]|jgi:hypothetical protein|nr:hypothetical protein [Candidatus Angelobacter sp.]
MAQQPQRPPRAVALANGGVAASILVVVAAFGVAVSQSRPPSIAAFAPDVQQHAQQKGLQGQEGANALGAAGGGTPTPAPSPTPSPARAGANATPTPNPNAGRPALVRCYGSPPRQTEDPQSPPCKQSFQGDNGGATYPGVTRDTIYVAWPYFDKGLPPPDNHQVVIDLQNYFNAHFQLYGRQIKLVERPPTNTAFAQDTAQQQYSDADYIATQANPSGGIFASIGYAPEGGTAYYFNDRLATHGILSISSAALLRTEAQLAASVYTWNTVPGYDKVEANLGNLYCHQLKGGAPSYAGPPTPPATAWGPRKIAVYYETTTDNVAIDPQPLVSTLSACGVQVTAQALGSDSASNTAAVNQMQQNADTTVACLCAPGQLNTLMSSASNQAYFPEWLVSNEQFLTYDKGAQGYPASEQPHVIGIDFNNEVLDPQNQFWYRAVREMDSGATYAQTSQNIYSYYRYEELLLLASGIQQAGPDLTPQSFQQGLYATQFSNVGHGAAPYYQAAVSFGPGDHSFYDDAAAVWFDPSGNSYTTDQGNPGTYCYSHLGDRSADWTRPSPDFRQGQTCRGG